MSMFLHPFTEALSSPMLLRCVLQALSSLCAHKLSQGGSNPVTVEAKMVYTKSSCWRPTNPAQFLRMCPRSVLLKVEMWLENNYFLDPWKNFRLQWLTITSSLVQNKPEESSPQLSLWRQSSWLRLDAWLLTLCSVQRHHFQTLRSDNSVCWRHDQRWSFFIRIYEDSILQVIQQTSAPLQTLLNHCCTQHEFPG